MRFNFFSRWFAIGMIAAALVMSCSKDDKNDEPKLNNAVRIDGETKPIIGARINESELADNNYDMFIYLSEKEGFVIHVAKQHHEGQTINLTKKEPERDGGGYWYVGYYKSEETIFDAYAAPGASAPVFQSGTLYLKRLDDVDGYPVFEIELKNGKIKAEGRYGDGKEHTISFHYKGKLELFKIGVIKDNAVMIDGETKPIVGAKIDEDRLAENNYDMYIDLSESEYVRIIGSNQHHDGQTINLTKKEPQRDGWYWRVEYVKSGKIIFDTYADPNQQSHPVFQSGTLYLKRLDDVDGQPVFEIELENGKVKGEEGYGDGEEHTIRLYYAGKLELGKF
ncbi:hypothetical protein ACI760_00085 [Capnocytophaga canimorsus]|uniref:hypothetical protein n=1 Tax=Capnocytophaga canimorsus TaxID=28188 RepID=UPI00385BEAF4